MYERGDGNMTIISAPHLYHLYPLFFFPFVVCFSDIPEPLTTKAHTDLILSPPTLSSPQETP